MHSTHGCAAGVSLRSVLRDATFFGANDIRVGKCCSDSRKCEPGDTFVAVTGAEFDGHDFVDEAIRRGATAVVSERLLPLEVPVCVVDDSRIALGQICQALAGSPTKHLEVIGVSGTSGKTTVSVLLGAILEAAQQSVSVCSSLAETPVRLNAKRKPRVQDRQSSLSAPELARWLHRSAVRGDTHAVIEMDSVSLATHRVSGVALDMAILTNVKRSNLEVHGSVANYRAAQARLVDLLKHEGVLVSNADDRGCQAIARRATSPCLTFGIHEQADVNARVLERHASEQVFLLMAGSEAVPVRTRTIGDQHIYSCLAAATAALVMGMDLPLIARGLESVDTVPGRMERLECGQEFSVFVDNARSPDALASALNTLRRVTSGRLICVYSAEGERDQTDRPLLGRVVERVAHVGVITANNPRYESELRIAHDIMDGYANVRKARVIANREQAIQWALNEAKPGDTVLIAGKGAESFQLLGGKQLAWDDREITCHILYEQAKHEPRIIPFPQMVMKHRT